jgi:hypothetical protein
LLADRELLLAREDEPRVFFAFREISAVERVEVRYVEAI